MAALKACSALVTGANRGLGLEMVKQLLEAHCSKVVAGCLDPDGTNSEALRELAKKHPDVADPRSIKESAEKVGSLLGKNCLNLFINNAAVLPSKSMLTATVEDMIHAFKTNVLGPLFVIRASLNMLTVYTAMELKVDEILCISIHPGWVRTDMGGEKAPIDAGQSVEGMLRVIGSLTEKQHGGFMDYTGETLPW